VYCFVLCCVYSSFDEYNTKDDDFERDIFDETRELFEEKRKKKEQKKTHNTIFVVHHHHHIFCHA